MWSGLFCHFCHIKRRCGPCSDYSVLCTATVYDRAGKLLTALVDIEVPSGHQYTADYFRATYVSILAASGDIHLSCLKLPRYREYQANCLSWLQWHNSHAQKLGDSPTTYNSVQK